MSKAIVLDMDGTIAKIFKRVGNFLLPTLYYFDIIMIWIELL